MSFLWFPFDVCFLTDMKGVLGWDTWHPTSLDLLHRKMTPFHFLWLHFCSLMICCKNRFPCNEKEKFSAWVGDRCGLTWECIAASIMFLLAREAFSCLQVLNDACDSCVRIMMMRHIRRAFLRIQAAERIENGEVENVIMIPLQFPFPASFSSHDCIKSTSYRRQQKLGV